MLNYGRIWNCSPLQIACRLHLPALILLLNYKQDRSVFINYIYNCDSPFHDYHYWPKKSWNRYAREYSLYVQFTWATVYWNSDALNGEDPWLQMHEMDNLQCFIYYIKHSTNWIFVNILTSYIVVISTVFLLCKLI